MLLKLCEFHEQFIIGAIEKLHTKINRWKLDQKVNF